MSPERIEQIRTDFKNALERLRDALKEDLSKAV
jgi:hypothetical protein